jgi:hypothetical protein
MFDSARSLAAGALVDTILRFFDSYDPAAAESRMFAISPGLST